MRSEEDDGKIPAPSPSRQIAFHQLLVAARKIWLADALREAVTRVDPVALKKQLAVYVPTDAQRILAGAGIRDEEVFPTPLLLEAKPTLVGYYRLLLGVPQKSFYAASAKTAPTTRSWFDAAQVLGRNGEDWEEFRRGIAGAVGIPLD